MLAFKELVPTAVLFDAVVFDCKELLPTAVLDAPVFNSNAPNPIPVLSSPVVTVVNAA